MNADTESLREKMACLEAERDALEAEVAKLREAGDARESDEVKDWMTRALRAEMKLRAFLNPLGRGVPSPTIHVFAQMWTYDNANIVSTPAGLAAIQAAIGRARSGGFAAVEAYTNDGKGFDLCIYAVDDDVMGKLAVPYTDELDREPATSSAIWPHQIKIDAGTQAAEWPDKEAVRGRERPALRST